jgi:hypothetical protein
MNHSFRSGESAKIHELAVAASLHRNSRPWLILEVLRHYCGRAAHKSKRGRQHPCIAHGNKLGHAGTIAGRQDFYRVARSEVSVPFARGLPPQESALPVSLGLRAAPFATLRQ